MKTLMTGLMALALVAGAGLAQAKDSSSQSQKSQSGQSGSSYGGTVSGSQSSQMGSQTGTSSRGSTAGQDARSIIKDWPQVSQQAAQNMLDRYGQPDVASNLLLIWKDKTPFTRITVTRDAVAHNFPTEHQDVLTEEIKLNVPVEKVSELARFDGSILVDRTKGTVAARSDKESSNFLALNLADDIINGRRDADSARKFYTDTLAKQMSGKSSAYTQKLNFSVSGETSNPDTPSYQPGGNSAMPSGSSSEGSSSGSSGSSSGGSSSDQMNQSSPSQNQDIGSPSGTSSPSGGGSQRQGD